MKLFYLVMWRMSTILVVILTCWAVLFYLAIMEEVNDEVDDSLSDYAESLIIRSLSGEQMPDTSNARTISTFCMRSLRNMQPPILIYPIGTRWCILPKKERRSLPEY